MVDDVKVEITCAMCGETCLPVVNPFVRLAFGIAKDDDSLIVLCPGDHFSAPMRVNVTVERE